MHEGDHVSMSYCVVAQPLLTVPSLLPSLFLLLEITNQGYYMQSSRLQSLSKVGHRGIPH